MKWASILLTIVLLLTGECEASDERSDVGHDEDVHPNTLTETNGDVLDMIIQTSRDVLDTNVETIWDINNDNYEDTDWHPPASLLETHSDLSPDTQSVIDSRNTVNTNHTFNRIIDSSSAQCGEYSSHLTSSGQCRLMATLPPVLLRSLEFRHAKTDTLLYVHAALLYELQTQLHNLSAAVQRMSSNTGCTIKVLRTTPLLSMPDTPDGQHLSFCPSDCASLYNNGVRHSGVYTIILSPGAILPVYCDMETEGGGWTVFQRRRDGLVSFNRGWSEYRDGFGEPKDEHWLGNQQLHLLSNQEHYSLRIDLQDWSHAHRHALYHSFRIENEENQYRLHVSGFSGTVEDSFGWYHDQHGFSTPDTGNLCAEISHAGWWFHQCFYANLNGVYYKGGRYSLKAQNLLGPDGIVWFSLKESDFYSLKAVTMMIRPRNFRPRLSP
ncbi:microfibril-associated glycoprotein 4-like [Cottoperca gobio]|uniref:Microfibril-associated glycoprotein 4-like n=1 Tax=Cottoperca gobio TaxID=56716 RepID=A0A6J2QMG6_COTGO|nr:microfibril-associated glycoprotein 4-like [Cottoperca gobio]